LGHPEDRPVDDKREPTLKKTKVCATSFRIPHGNVVYIWILEKYFRKPGFRKIKEISFLETK